MCRAGVTHGARFAHDHDLYLTGKGQLVAHAFGNVECKNLSVVVADPISTNHHANLSASIDGVHVFHAVERIGDLRQLHDSVNVPFGILPSPARSNRRDGIGCLHQEADRIESLVVFVMLGDHLLHDRVLLEAFCHLDPKLDVRTFLLARDGLANVVQEPRASG